MRVHELIEMLQQLDTDKRILIEDFVLGLLEVNDIKTTTHEGVEVYYIDMN